MRSMKSNKDNVINLEEYRQRKLDEKYHISDEELMELNKLFDAFEENDFGDYTIINEDDC